MPSPFEVISRNRKDVQFGFPFRSLSLQAESEKTPDLPRLYGQQSEERAFTAF
jgi:hypothetical protein